MAGSFGENRKQFRLHWGRYYRSREVEPYIRSLENEIHGSSSRINNMEDEMAALQETIDVKNRKIDELRQLTDDAEEKLRESGKMREEAVARLEQIEEESQKLMAQKEELHKTRLETNKRLAEAEQRTNQARQEAETAVSTRAQCMDAVRELQAKSQEAQQAAEAAEARRNEAVSEREAAESALTELNETIDKLNAQSKHILDDANVQAEVAIGEAKDKAERILTDARAQAEHLMNEAAAQAASNQATIAPYQARIDQLEQEIGRLQGIIASGGNTADAGTLAQYQGRIAQLEQELVNARSTSGTGNGASEQELAEARSRIAELERQVQSMQAPDGAADASAADAGILGAYRERIAQLENENRYLQSAGMQPDPAIISGYQNRIMLLEQELRDLQQYGLNQQIAGQDNAIEALRANLDESQRAYQDMADQNRELHMRIEQQAREISELENEVQGSSVKDANQRARQIIQDALEESGRILDEAEMVRSRAFAATKAAYFNALMFRQRLAEQFTDIEQSLDDSLGILRSTDMVALSPRMNREYQTDPRWTASGEGKEGNK
ncbi:MAG: hypothetical protein IJ242_12205 [Clostridia bacterium]|nr:hypothetical protein [Clostridia bacterium]